MLLTFFGLGRDKVLGGLKSSRISLLTSAFFFTYTHILSPDNKSIKDPIQNNMSSSR